MRKLLILAPFLIAAPLIAAGHAATKAKSPHMGHEMAKKVDTTKITGGTYSTDPGHSLIGWRVNHFGFNDYFGLFGDVAGTLTLDPKNPAASKVDVTIPISKIVTASAGLNSHLYRPGKDGAKPDFFGENPADARFVSTSVKPQGQMAMIAGNLTMNGMTKPVTLHANLSGAGTNIYNKKETIGFHAKTSIKRSEWGLGFGAPVAVGDKVDLEITVAFEK